METIQRPRHGTNGVWLDFVGVRWYSSGASASYSADRFTKVGEYRGFPVYVETVGSKDHDLGAGRQWWTARTLRAALAVYYSIFPDPFGCSGG